MSPHDSFLELMQKVRAGDQEAAAKLVRAYEPAVRRLVRIRLRSSRLRRVVDSVDICQSVLGAFFVRVALGDYDLSSPEDLQRLLAVMARNKIVSRARLRSSSEEDGNPALEELASPEATPSQQLEARDLLEKFRQRLTDEERWLAEQRSLNRPWAEIAVERGDTPEALRKRLTRALDRVAGELHLEEWDHG
jgi:RNA polymerase sigma-70 factor (ECF subfamily)